MTKKRCYYCGHKLSRKNKTIDHVIPLSKGGSDKTRNKVLACRTCNEEKGCLMPNEFRAILAFRAESKKNKLATVIFYTPFYGEEVK